MAVTIKQIAEMTGLSRGTVDRVINNRGKVSPEAEKLIKATMSKLGYKPKLKNKTEKIIRKIGIITQLSSASFMIEINRGIQQAKKELKDKMIEIILKENDSVDEEKQLKDLNDLIKSGIDGLAIMPVEDELIRKAINKVTDELKIPVVTFNSDIVGTKRKLFVGLNNLQSGKAAAGLMGIMTRGLGKVLIITGHFTNNVNNARVEGFIDEIEKSFPEIELMGVQSSKDKAEEVEKIVINAITEFPELAGIFLVSAGQSGIRSAFEKLKVKNRPYTIMYDLTPKNIKALQDNIVDFLIDQAGFEQGYTALNILSEMILKGIDIDNEFLYTEINIRTRYNV